MDYIAFLLFFVWSFSKKLRFLFFYLQRSHAETAKAEAEAAKNRAEKLAANKLRALGIDPESLDS